MTRAVIPRPLTAMSRLQFQDSLCGLCGGQIGKGQDVSPTTSVFPVSIIPQAPY
jgi:hypothetical protein